jgi:TolB-like protein/Tfp pilus assembly protein PilF/class 3 adenylate cyclase
MSAEVKTDGELEIVHVLFIDTVGYSKLLLNEQREVQDLLNRVVRNTDCFRNAETAEKLVRLPTGDGMALVFTEIEAPLKCALEISKALRDNPQLSVRMGIHSGPVSRVLDVNDRVNIAGAGINIAQRVMSCGDAGHILLSRRAAEDIAHHQDWQPYLHDLGEFEAKHGTKVNVVNLYTEEAGNPELPMCFKRLAQERFAAAALQFRRRRKVQIALAGTVLVACLAAGVFLLFPRSSMSTSRQAVAVLPFLDLSQAKDQEYFSDGITEQIINSLGKIRGLLVVARSSAFSFKNKNQDVREIGKLLRVTHVLEGSVLRSPGKTRIDARLVDVRNGFQLWTESYDSNEQDVLAVQDNVAKEVASALQLQFRLAAGKPLTQNPEAYDLYLRGRYFLNKRTADSIRKARDLFEQAVEKDPRFALGQAGIADAYILLGEYGEMSSAETSKSACPKVTAALAIDDDLAEAHASRAMLLAHFDWNWPAAETEYRRAIELNPNYALAHHWYALHLAELGRFDEALAEIAAAQKQDPLAPIIHAAKGKILFVARRYDQAITQCRNALDLEPNFGPAFFILGQAYTNQGKFPEAITAMKKYAQSDEDTSLELAYVYAAAGQRDQAEAIVQKATASGDVSSYEMATVGAAGHDEAGALRWLETAIDRHSLSVVWMRVDPRLDNIRSHGRYRELVAKLVPRKPPPPH